VSPARLSEQIVAGGERTLVLADDRLQVTVLPDRGADIHAVRHVASGVDVLWKTPWGLHGRSGEDPAPGSPGAWLDTYAGGWQVLFPSSGGQSYHDGVQHPYHGEACSRPWTATTASGAGGGDRVELRVRLSGSPLALERTVSLVPGRSQVVVEERVTNEGDRTLDYLWVHHPAFGAPLVAPGARIRTSATTILADAALDGSANPLAPGTRHDWPVVETREGRPLDLSVVPKISPGRTLLGYLSGFDEGSVSIENDALALACTLSWPVDVFPYAWLWQELGGTAGPPWFGDAYALAIEPATSYPATGLGAVVATTGTHRVLPAGESASAELRLRVAAIER
jgi:galactose mutarotase-like enzyme